MLKWVSIVDDWNKPPVAHVIQIEVTETAKTYRVVPVPCKLADRACGYRTVINKSDGAICDSYDDAYIALLHEMKLKHQVAVEKERRAWANVQAVLELKC